MYSISGKKSDKMIIETERLRIVPLTMEQFYLLLTNAERLDNELGLGTPNNRLDRHTQEAMEGLYARAMNHKENYLWYTNWQIILASENKSIGSACFMGMPNSSNKVEIGYGINKEYENRGYMTEAVKEMCAWALSQPDVKYVIAETDKKNIASHRVLRKCNMTKYKETDKSIWWNLEK